MTEFASLGGETGFTPGGVALWNETSSGLALLGDLGRFDDGNYGLWEGFVPPPFVDTGGAGKGKKTIKRSRPKNLPDLTYFRRKYIEERTNALDWTRRLTADQAEAEQRALEAQERETQQDIEALETEISIYREARANDQIVLGNLTEILRELEELLALALEAQLAQNRMKAALIAVMQFFY